MAHNGDACRPHLPLRHRVLRYLRARPPPCDPEGVTAALGGLTTACKAAQARDPGLWSPQVAEALGGTLTFMNALKAGAGGPFGSPVAV